jgi:BirA family biotin operon repressor/biotin-[acetyl-CoA-carboxylase] ligase
MVKWPNDCQIEGGKVAGILTELCGERDRVNYIILGVGININQQMIDFPIELQKIATSLAIEAERPIDRVEVLCSFLKRLESYYATFVADGPGTFIEAYTKICSLIGREVTAQIGRNTVTGIATQIDPGGALVLEAEGKDIILSAGEVINVR